jgi:hypothetical protein
VIKRRWCAAALALAACGGGAAAPGAVKPTATPSAVVQSFLQAAADSNVTKMATLWGTSRGPASETHTPADWERRVAVMQAYLAADDFRITGDAPDGSESRHAVQAELRRQACTFTIPFTVIQLSNREWLINQVDVGAAGNPKRPCRPEEQDTTTAPASP